MNILSKEGMNTTTRNESTIPNEKKEETLEMLENTTIKLKADNQMKILEDETKSVVSSMKTFSCKIPPLVKQVGVITEELNSDKLKNTLEGINKNSKTLIDTNKRIEENLDFTIDSLVKSTNKYTSYILEKTKQLKEETDKILSERKYFYNLLDTFLIAAFIILIFLNIWVALSYRSEIKKVNLEMKKIHQILKSDKKYWIDSENYNVYIKDK